MNPAQDAADLLHAARRECTRTAPPADLQRCLSCESVRPVHVEEFSDPNNHHMRRIPACVVCGSWNVQRIGGAS